MAYRNVLVEQANPQECSKCGVVVTDTDTHDEFHERLDNLIYP